MIEKILKSTYVNQKVELSQEDYNRLVEMAQLNAKKIAERARKFYEKEGVVKIEFTGRLIRNKYGEVECDRYTFECDCEEYLIHFGDGYDKHFFTIPQESRKKIAQKVRNYVKDCFYYNVGSNMSELNEIERLKNKQLHRLRTFIVWTVTGWLSAVAMLLIFLLK